MTSEERQEELRKIAEDEGMFFSKKYILVCSCSGQSKKATEAFSVILPNAPIPEIVKGRDKIFKLGEKLKNDHIKAISKLHGRYSYFVEWEDGKIIREYDLITGKRIC